MRVSRGGCEGGGGGGAVGVIGPSLQPGSRAAESHGGSIVLTPRRVELPLQPPRRSLPLLYIITRIIP